MNPVRPSGALITGVIAKLCPDAAEQADIMRKLGPDLAAPICGEFPGGYLMPQLTPLDSAASVPAVLRGMWASVVEDDRSTVPELYAKYVHKRLAAVPAFLRQELRELLDRAVQPAVSYHVAVHGDATLANFMRLGDRTVAIDVSPRVHYGSPTQDISKLLLSFYGGLHCPVTTCTVLARADFEIEATEHIRYLGLGYDWRWDPDNERLSVSENLLWDLYANAIRVLSREENPRLYNFVRESVGVL